VVVANSQVRILTTDVRKVFDAIVISIEWVDLKASPNWSKMGHAQGMSPNLLKRKKVKIPLRCEDGGVHWGQTWWVSFPIWIRRGDSNKRYDGKRDPIQSFLFCIKATFCLGNRIKYEILWSFICWEKEDLFALIRGQSFYGPFMWESGGVKASNLPRTMCIPFAPWKIMCCYIHFQTTSYR